MAKKKTVADIDKELEKLTVEAEKELTARPGRRLVTMDNAVARAASNLSLTAKRIVILAMSKIDSRKPVDSLTTKFHAKEFSEAYGVDPDNAYKQLKEGCEELYELSMTFVRPWKNAKGKEVEMVSKMRWVGQADYVEKEGWVTLEWWPKALPLLTGLKEKFTSYQLHQASALRSLYSWKLLEFLKSYPGGHAEISVIDFCTMMEATEKQRADFGEVRRRMIEPPIRELRAKDGWDIQWSGVKAGRTYRTLIFDYSRDPQGDLFRKTDES